MRPVLRHTRNVDGTPLVSGKRVTGFANSEEDAVQLTQIVPFLVEDMSRPTVATTPRARIGIPMSSSTAC